MPLSFPNVCRLPVQDMQGPWEGSGKNSPKTKEEKIPSNENWQVIAGQVSQSINLIQHIIVARSFAG
ncbi:hypothetical protein TNCV_1287841 [Trichonephila clavipes]|nr:hypothetical protein TNCV_1287841 [Trichonephila clavipes]